MADDEALRGVAFADADFLDAEVLADRLVAALARERGLRVRGPVAHPFAGDPVPARPGEVAQVLVRAEAAVDDGHDAAESPAAEVVFDLGDHAHVVGVAGPDPDADRNPLARDGQADHDLREIGAVVL